MEMEKYKNKKKYPGNGTDFISGGGAGKTLSSARALLDFIINNLSLYFSSFDYLISFFNEIIKLSPGKKKEGKNRRYDETKRSTKINTRN